MGSKFYDRIHTATDEKDVEGTYNEGLRKYFKNAEIKHPHECDSFIDTRTDAGKYLKLLVEYKLDEKLNVPAARAKVLVQVLFYLQRFEQDGEILPNVVMVGDVNECFVLHSNCLTKYLDEQVDWSKAPSNAAAENPDLVLKIASDTDIIPFIYDVNDTFSFKNVAEQIIALADNVQRLVRITEHNISGIYDYFIDKVISNFQNVTSHELVAAFIGSITDSDNYFQHPTNPSVLMAKGKRISIDGNAYKSFFGYFKHDYSMAERNRFSEIADRLIEDTNRRKNGDFFTPTPFVDYAHQMLGEQLGDDWREKYVVWDCCWGTGNLTRDYKFNELYASTLMESELQMGEHYNREATKFQMDFLNDPFEPNLYGTNVPQSLLNAFKEDKPILFFINPPYGTPSSDFGKGDTNSKGQGMSVSMVNKQMVSNKMGEASNNLYAQFLYRILMLKNQYKLSNVCIGLYSTPLFLTGVSWKSFRKVFLSEFEFTDAMLFKASYFSNVSEKWGISFSIWRTGNTIDKISFNYRLVDFVNGSLSELDRKVIYNIDDSVTAKVWIRESIKKVTTISKPTFSSGIVLKEGKNCKTKIAEDALGCYSNMGNNVDQNEMKASLFSSCDSTNANGLSIMKENFDRVITIFAARKLITKNWINSKDEYLAPNEQHEKWQEFVNDCIVFSLFNSASNQTALRDIEFKGKKWTIKNEFFFMSKQRIMELADANKFAETYEDARTDTERYIYQRLQNIQLSDEAKFVLDKAIELTEKTFKYRQLFNQEHPEYQIMNWDCGWYQIKALVGSYLSAELKALNALYDKLSDKMHPMVYELGFLKP